MKKYVFSLIVVTIAIYGYSQVPIDSVGMENNTLRIELKVIQTKLMAEKDYSDSVAYENRALILLAHNIETNCKKAIIHKARWQKIKNVTLCMLIPAMIIQSIYFLKKQ